MRKSISALGLCALMWALGPNTALGQIMSVTNTLPSNGALDISVSNVVEVAFDNAVDTGTVSTASFTVRGQQYGVHPGTYSFPATHIVRFTPATNYLAGEHMEVSLSDSIRSQVGGTSEPYHVAFEITAEGCTNFIYADNGQSLGSAWRL